MFAVTVDRYALFCQSSGLPDSYDLYREHADLVDEVDLRNTEGEFCFLALARDVDWPFLVVAQKYWPAGVGFRPGALLIPETDILLLGAGERLLAYQLDPPKRLWEDRADTGFWGWHRHADTILMAAELELAAWSIHGQKLWSAFVEPPWEFHVTNERVALDVMGTKSTFPLREGPMKRLGYHYDRP